MLKLLLYLFCLSGVFANASMTLKLFPKKPPYALSFFYPLKLESTIRSLEECSSLNVCYIVANSNNSIFKDSLNLVKLPKHKKLLYVGSLKKRSHLLETLSEDNMIKIFSSTKRKDVEKAYLEELPDIVMLPLHLKKTLETLIRRHPSEKKVIAIFYPPKPSSKNFVVTLSKEALKKKLSSCKLKDIMEAKESFLLKKLKLTKEGKVVLKKEKPLTFNRKKADITLSLEDKILAMDRSLEDIKLGVGGFFYELEKLSIVATMHTKALDKHLDAALLNAGALYLFIPEKDPSNAKLLRKLKKYFKEHPEKSIFIGYYATPWREEWNLYHYHSHGGSSMIASVGLHKLTQDESLSLESLGGSFAECYLLKRFP